METFIWHLSASPSLSETPRVTTIKFGDGYEQRARYGINTLPQKWAVTFKNRLESEAIAVRDFLRARGGVESFLWTPPGEVNPLKFKCSEWEISPFNGKVYSISTTFEQVFDP